MYRASDGYLLQYRHWPAATPTPRAQIVALHGIQSHGGWYTYSCRRLADAGYEVFFLDRRGSGLNCCARGHALHEERLINDVVQFLTALQHRQRQSGAAIPIVLMGVSWGGKLAAAVGLKRPDLVTALALLYPGIYSRLRTNWWQQIRLQGAEAIGWGRVLLPIPLNEPSLFTDDPCWQDFIRRDELALQQASISLLLANLRLTKLIDEHAAELRLPMLMMLAGRDEIIDNATTKASFFRSDHPMRKLIEYSEARHTLEFEPEPDRFIDDLLSWLETLAV